MAVLVVVAAAGGCGGTQHSASVSRPVTTASTAASHSTPGAGAQVSSGQSSGSGVIHLSNVGSLSYRCDRATGQVSGTLGGPFQATEAVYVEDDRHRHLRMATLNPPAQLSVSGVQTPVMLWHVIQSTEARTLDVRITVDFRGGSGGAIDCSLTRWTSTTRVISHDKPWSVPAGWL